MNIPQATMTILIGGLAGWIASLLIGGGKKNGILLYILIGIIGAYIGNFVFDYLDISTTDGFTGNLIVATSGAALLLIVFRVLQK